MKYHESQKYDNRIILLHLKKTGGTSVYRHLIDAVSPDLVAPWNIEFNKTNNYRVIGGHYSMSEVGALDGIIISFFRNPIDRVISYYNYVKTLSQLEVARNGDLGAAAIRTMSLEQCLESDNHHVMHDISNYYCKTIFGSTYKREELFENGRLTPSAEKIINKINFIGIMEDFQNSIDNLLAFLGFSQAFMLHKEKDIKLLDPSISLASAEQVDDSLIERLENLNRDDIDLYKYFVSKKFRGQRGSPAKEIGSFPNIYPGKSYDFNRTFKYFRNILFSGWHVPEDGVWMNGASACLAFKTLGLSRTVLLYIELPFSDKYSSLRIGIDVNESQGFMVHCISSTSAIKISHPCDGDYFLAVPENGRVKIKIDLPECHDNLYFVCLSLSDTFVPTEYADYGDDRCLGAKLHRITCL